MYDNVNCLLFRVRRTSGSYTDQVLRWASYQYSLNALLTPQAHLIESTQFTAQTQRHCTKPDFNPFSLPETIVGLKQEKKLNSTCLNEVKLNALSKQRVIINNRLEIRIIENKGCSPLQMYQWTGLECST